MWDFIYSFLKCAVVDKQALIAKLQEWHGEFCSIADGFPVPDKFWGFVAQRIVDEGFAEEDWDVVRFRFADTTKKVRVIGLKCSRIAYEVVGNGMGLGLVPPKQVHPDDMHKLAEILYKLEEL